ncbi:MAG: CBS domain-containing protein, partial [Candidatus Hodarchaeales archaeon]
KIMTTEKVELGIDFPPVLNQEESVSKAMGLLQEGNDIIIIIDDAQKYIGLIRTRDIVGRGINPDALCKSYLDRRVPPIIENSSYDPIIVGEMMIKSGSRYIPVINKYNVIKGAIKDFKVLNELQNFFKEHNRLKIYDAVNWNLISLNEDDSVGNALASIRSHGFSRLPVFGSNGEILGIIMDRSFLKTQRERRATVGDITGDRDKDWHLLPVKDFLQPTEILTKKILILDIIDRFIVQEISSFFIQGDNEEYGIITPLDIIRLATTESYPEESDIVVMQAPDDSIKSHVIRKGNSIIKRNKTWLGSQCDLNVRFKRNLSQSKRGQFSVTVTIRLNSRSGKKYNSESTDFGAEKTVNKALDNLSRIISDDRKKVLAKRDQAKSFRKSSE